MKLLDDIEESNDHSLDFDTAHNHILICGEEKGFQNFMHDATLGQHLESVEDDLLLLNNLGKQQTYFLGDEYEGS